MAVNSNGVGISRENQELGLELMAIKDPKAWKAKADTFTEVQMRQITWWECRLAFWHEATDQERYAFVKASDGEKDAMVSAVFPSYAEIFKQ